MFRALVSFILFVSSVSVAAAIAPDWVRYPAVAPDGQSIAFTYRGDIYRVSAEGGEATRLTFHPAHDYQPVWSKDSQRIAFASERYGNMDVFIMDALGGEATRLTFDSSNEVPYDFSYQGASNDEYVLFKGNRMDSASHRQYPDRTFSELYQVPSRSGRVEQVFTLPVEEVHLGSRGKLMLYQDVKGYENEWRKHHVSAVTRDIWVYDTKEKTHKQLTTYQGEDRDPVFSDDNKTVYFLSEREGSFNVFSMPLSQPNRVKQLTTFSTHPVRFLSQAKGTLVFSHHGVLYTLKEKGKPQKIDVTIRTQNSTNNEVVNSVNGDISEFTLSPNGKEVAFIANGDVFVGNKEGSFTKQITDTPETEAHVSFAPDGKWLIYASEKDRKWRIHSAVKRNENEPFFYASSLIKHKVLIDSDKDSYLPQISPDGKKIAFIEDRRTLKVTDIDGSDSVTLVTKDKMIHMGDGDQYFQWSPDSQYILFTYDKLLNNSDIAVVKADGSAEVRSLFASAYYDYSPKWIMNGEAVLYVSNRHGLRSYATSGRSQDDVYAIFLNQTQWDKFNLSEDDFKLLEAIEEANEPQSEDSADTDEQEKSEKESENSDDDNETIHPIEIEWDGIDKRIKRITLHSSFLQDAVLDKKAEHLYYLTRMNETLGLWKTSLRTQETSKVLSLGDNYGRLKWDKDKSTLYLLSDGALSSLDLDKEKTTAINFRAKVKKSSSDLYSAAFEHVWLRTQKAFYDPEFHGADWKKMYKDYQPKVAHIATATEFAELVSELVGELNVSHAGARAFSGFNIENKDETGRLGIFYDSRFTGNGIKITEVLKNGPLDKANINVQSGDVITHIDGVKLDENLDWASLLNQKANTFVLLTVSRDQQEPKNITVKPISNGKQTALLYERFISINEQEVLEQSNGKLGYVHVPSMSDPSYRKVFDTMLGKHSDKQGMVVDTRFNNGGDLVADLAMFFTGERFISYETVDKVVGGEPTSRYTKPIVGLFNEDMYSDGHCYASAFKDLNLGTSIGMPVPGTCSFAGWESLPVGVFWGMVPISAKNKQGEWMENNQMQPDIVIKNRPSTISSGTDEQLEKAINTLLKQVN